MEKRSIRTFDQYICGTYPINYVTCVHTKICGAYQIDYVTSVHRLEYTGIIHAPITLYSFEFALYNFRPIRSDANLYCLHCLVILRSNHILLSNIHVHCI